ncbi:MAG: amidophosphoribosyltransferase [Parcubacteria group bacterium Athens0714_16]|nr:MAG: amidophosphoribosyltransferase [Parcubacteria group bacterium Athens0714_16]
MLSIKRTIDAVLNFLFPFSETRKKIESLTPEGVLEKCEMAEISDDKNVLSIFSYENKLMREMIHFLKYKGNKNVAKLFAEILYSEMIERMSEMSLFENFTNPVLVPIPLSNKKFKRRGFNQIELILKELKQIDTGNIFEVNTKSLIKIKDTLSQTAVKNRRRRMENIRNCFGVINTEKINKRNIILIDDVLTTGATMREARNALIKAGAKEVFCLTVAH